MTAYLRTRTFYVITNRKLMIRKGSRIQIHDGRNLPPMNLVIHKNGNGTILFTQNVYTSKGSRSSTAFAIENIADVAQRWTGWNVRLGIEKRDNRKEMIL